MIEGQPFSLALPEYRAARVAQPLADFGPGKPPLSGKLLELHGFGNWPRHSAASVKKSFEVTAPLLARTMARSCKGRG
jgi:hypothetical protein